MSFFGDQTQSFFGDEIILTMFEFIWLVYIEVTVESGSALSDLTWRQLQELTGLRCGDAEGGSRLRREEQPTIQLVIVLHVFHILANLDGPHFLVFQKRYYR